MGEESETYRYTERDRKTDPCLERSTGKWYCTVDSAVGILHSRVRPMRRFSAACFTIGASDSEKAVELAGQACSLSNEGQCASAKSTQIGGPGPESGASSNNQVAWMTVVCA